MTTTGSQHELTSVARTDDEAAADVFGRWTGEPIARLLYVTRIEAATL